MGGKAKDAFLETPDNYDHHRKEKQGGGLAVGGLLIENIFFFTIF